MPLYEYRCKACGKVFDRIAKINDPNPKCDAEACEGETERLISRTSFILKGGGWASDGYSSGGGKTS